MLITDGMIYNISHSEGFLGWISNSTECDSCKTAFTVPYGGWMRRN